MANQPVYYMQTDSKWGYNDYSAKGEKTTIRASGCGPSSMAMVVATWVNSSVTPATECAWALANGWKCPNSGTYYGYFEAAGKHHGLTVTRLNTASIYGNSTSACHAKAANAMANGDLVIACMGKGTWTSSGHYIVCWNLVGNTIYINDPASTKPARTQGNYATFKKQVKYYWVIKNPGGAAKTTPTTKIEEDEDMTQDKFNEMMGQYRLTLQDNDANSYSEEARKWAVETGLIGGSQGADGNPNYMWADMLTREQMAVLLHRFAKIMGKA